MNLLSEYMVPWVISNSIAILVLIAAIRKPKLTRILFAILFIWACWLNYTTVHKNPNEYLNYAALTPFSLYSNFINGWFKLHIIPMVSIISIGQGLIAIGLMLKGRIVRSACFGAIIFFLAIAPLGIGSAFPSTLIASVAIYFILKNDNLSYLWKSKIKNN
mgnify:CR=1 FL=1